MWGVVPCKMKIFKSWQLFNVGTNCVFLPMHFFGLKGGHRRYVHVAGKMRGLKKFTRIGFFAVLFSIY